MAVDRELQRHLETWQSFGRLLQWSVGLIVLILVILALCLL
jgi:hypothetical protein